MCLDFVLSPPRDSVGYCFLSVSLSLPPLTSSPDAFFFLLCIESVIIKESNNDLVGAESSSLLSGVTHFHSADLLTYRRGYQSWGVCSLAAALACRKGSRAHEVTGRSAIKMHAHCFFVLLLIHKALIWLTSPGIRRVRRGYRGQPRILPESGYTRNRPRLRSDRHRSRPR